MLVPPQGIRNLRMLSTIILLMGAICVAQSFGRFTYAFVLPGARDDVLGGSNWLAGLFGSLNLAAYLAGTVIVGAATTRLSLGTVTRIGLLASTAGLGLASVASSAAMLGGALILMGLGGAAIWIPGPALAASVVSPRRRGLVVGLLVSAIGAGAVLIGRMPDLLGEGDVTALWRRIYGLEFVLAVGVTVAVFGLLRTSGGSGGGRRGGGVAALRGVRGWLPLTAAYASFGFSYMLVAAFFVARVRDDAGFTVAQISWLFSIQGIASIASGLLLGPLADRFGHRRTLMGAFAVAAAATVAALSHAPIVVALAAIALSAGSTGAPAVISAYVVDHTSPRTYGPAFSSLTFGFGAMQMLAPQVGGLLADVTGSFVAVFLLSAAVRLLGLLAVSRLPDAEGVGVVHEAEALVRRAQRDVPGSAAPGFDGE